MTNQRLSVYQVKGDLERYRSLLLDLPEREFGTARSRLDAAPPVYIDNFEARSPDIWQLTSMGTVLVFTPDIIEQLEPFICLAGDLFPLHNATAEPWEFSALLVTNVLEVDRYIDTSFREEERDRLLAEVGYGTDAPRSPSSGTVVADPYPFLAPAFRPESLSAVPRTFFCLDRLKASVFLLDRDDEDDTLLRRIEALRLTGLRSDLVWSTSRGPAHMNLFRS